MPFCRECGKEVQEDWITCPYCSKSIGPPAQSLNMQDSVVAGDVNIVNSVAESSACQSCGSTNAKTWYCSRCDIQECELCNPRCKLPKWPSKSFPGWISYQKEGPAFCKSCSAEVEEIWKSKNSEWHEKLAFLQTKCEDALLSQKSIVEGLKLVRENNRFFSATLSPGDEMLLIPLRTEKILESFRGDRYIMKDKAKFHPFSNVIIENVETREFIRQSHTTIAYSVIFRLKESDSNDIPIEWMDSYSGDIFDWNGENGMYKIEGKIGLRRNVFLPTTGGSDSYLRKLSEIDSRGRIKTKISNRNSRDGLPHKVYERLKELDSIDNYHYRSFFNWLYNPDKINIELEKSKIKLVEHRMSSGLVGE